MNENHSCRGRHIVLTGMPGSGKSSVGRELALLLDRPFVDIDALIEAHCRKRISRIFATMGEDRFREIEHEMISKALAEPCPAVISTGGGAVLRAANRELMKQDGWVVYMRVPAGVLLERTRREKHRPLLRKNPEEVLTGMLAARGPLYEMADFTVEAHGAKIGEVAGRIREAYGNR